MNENIHENTQMTISERLNLHKKWIFEETNGARFEEHGTNLREKNLRNVLLYKADLSGADLTGTDLTGAYLGGAALIGTDLTGAVLTGAVLTGADLTGAYLGAANLTGTDLTAAVLSKASLIGTNLDEAILYGADLRGADLYEARVGNARCMSLQCPEEGAFIAWKKCGLYIVKLQITEKAKRSSATSRRCRCSEALVLDIQNIDGSPSGIVSVASNYDKNFIYRIGEIARVDDFDEDRWSEYTSGIHFFITRDEAVNYMV